MSWWMWPLAVFIVLCLGTMTAMLVLGIRYLLRWVDAFVADYRANEERESREWAARIVPHDAVPMW